MIKKYQVKQKHVPLGHYLAALARAAPISEVSAHNSYFLLEKHNVLNHFH